MNRTLVMKSLRGGVTAPLTPHLAAPTSRLAGNLGRVDGRS
jgi:hypothetical protein